MTIASAATLEARGRQHIRELGALGVSLGLHVVVILAIAFMTLSPPREPPSLVVELLYEQPPAATEGPVVLHPEAAQQQAQAVPEVRPSDPEPEAAPPMARNPEPPVPQPEPDAAPREPELAELPPEPLPEPALALEPAPLPPQTKPRPERAAPQPAPVVASERAAPADALAAAPVAQAPPAAVAAAPSAPPSVVVPAPAPSPPSVSYGSALLRWLERYREYPRTARLRRIEGVVVLRLTIERDGRLAEVTVAETSGSPILDEAALEMARRAAPLPPLPQSEAVERVVMLVPIAFRLT